jgi:OOP family OmpA-OmpF porin
MFKLKHITTALLAASCAVVQSGVVQAEDSHQWEVTGMAGMNAFDSDRNLDDAATGSLGLGYVLSKDWTLEGFYQGFDADIDNGIGGVDGRQLRLDALYHFAQLGDGSWRPFVLAGLGDQEFDGKGFKDNETFGNLGLGIKKQFSDSWLVRGDARTLYSFDEDETDYGVNVGLSYLFGGKKTAAEKDSDMDGVFDSLDQCPNTPAGAAVDSVGCPLDSDMDGVADYLDNCLNTPHGVKVNEEGCVLTSAEDVSFDLSLRFDHDGDTIMSHNSADVDRVIRYLEVYPAADIVIEGHTDSSGPASYNKGLSERRADAMLNLLTGQYGIDAARLSAAGYGEERPIADNSTAEGRAANRRVVAKVLENK